MEKTITINDKHLAFDGKRCAGCMKYFNDDEEYTILSFVKGTTEYVYRCHQCEKCEESTFWEMYTLLYDGEEWYK